MQSKVNKEKKEEMAKRDGLGPESIEFVLPFFGAGVDVALDTECFVQQARHSGDAGCAVAELRVSARTLRRVFGFKTRRIGSSAVLRAAGAAQEALGEGEADGANGADGAGEDVEFYVRAACWPWAELNLADARVTENAVLYRSQQGAPLEAREMSVAHDYIRYLAQRVFNTAYGASLFRNQEAVMGEIRRLCRSGDLFGHALRAVDCERGSYAGLAEGKGGGGDGQRCLTARKDRSAMNVGYHLLRQIARCDPERLLRMPDRDCTKPSVFHELPLRPRDCIVVSLAIHASESQHQVLARALAPIPPRHYLVRLVLV